MLHHHPEIAFPGELGFLVTLVPDGEGWPSLETYYEWLSTNRIFQSTGLETDPCLNYPELMKSFLQQISDREGKRIVGGTVHQHFNRLLRIWPDARFIHLIRDGREVARSCINMGWAGNVWTGVERWLEVEKLWSQLCKLVPSKYRIDISYEQLIRKPHQTLRSICEFIGIKFSPVMFDYIEKTNYDMPDQKLVQQWRNKLSNREIQLVESRIANMLVKRGYELSGLPLLDVTSRMKLLLKSQDLWAKRVFRLRKYGIRLFLMESISRQLGLSAWQKRVKVRINKVDIAHLK